MERRFWLSSKGSLRAGHRHLCCRFRTGGTLHGCATRDSERNLRLLLWRLACSHTSRGYGHLFRTAALATGGCGGRARVRASTRYPATACTTPQPDPISSRVVATVPGANVGIGTGPGHDDKEHLEAHDLCQGLGISRHRNSRTSCPYDPRLSAPGSTVAKSERSSFTANGESPPQRLTAFLKSVGMLDEPLWTVREAARFLSVSTKTVRAWQYGRCMPFLKIGGTVRFVPADIRRWALELSVVPGTAVDVPPPARHRPEPRRTLARLAPSTTGVSAGRSTALPSP